MTEFLGILKKTKLFSNLSDDEICAVLTCLNAKIKSFNKNDFIFYDGNEAEFIGIILSGEVLLQKVDYNGNANIISNLYPADCIAASVCYSSDKRLPFDVICTSECKIICLDKNRLIRSCFNACSFHVRIIENILNIIADRNIALAGKIDILTKRTIREKILVYLYAQSKRAKNKRFSLSMSRRQMAEYLSVNRSALSRELCNLRNENLLDFEKNNFFLKKHEKDML